jgi:hypothetical protein
MILDTVDPLWICKYRWTEAEAWKAKRYHGKKNFRWPFRGLAYFVLGGILLISSWSLFTYGFALPSFAMLAFSFYFLFLLRLEARWWHLRRFRIRPDRDALVEYALSDDGISAKAEGLAESRSTWAAVFRVLRTPEGFLVYPNESVMYWLPRDGFAAAGAMEALDSLFRAKVPRYASL